MKKSPEKNLILKRRTPLFCPCKEGKKRKEKERSKYGVNFCDTYSFNYSVGIILANALFHYLAEAKDRIIREDFIEIEKCAEAIKEFSLADSWDSLSENRETVNSFFEKEKKFRWAMFWLGENWKTLWW